MNALSKRCGVAVALGAAAFLAACHDSGGGSSSTPATSTTTTENFSTLATTTFKAQANSTPVNYDNLNIVYDVNDDPTAFNALFAM